jgi:hypothetical protein
MKYYGITGTAYKLMQSYRDNRYQRTVIKDKNLKKLFSSWKIIKHRVQQGSVLGRLLFLIYINDLPITICKIARSIIFADDTSIIRTNDNMVDFRNTLYLTMIEISSWFRSNLLTLNYDKTHFLQFLTKKKKKNEMQPTNSHLQFSNY